MRKLAELLDRLAYEPSRNNKLRLMADHFRNTPDPERGFALAALTGALSWLGVVLCDEPGRRRPVWPVYVCTAIGTLAKGPVAMPDRFRFPC